MRPDRRGFALPAALVALLLLSTLAATVHLATRVEARGAARVADGTRALLSAEAGLAIAENAATRQVPVPPAAGAEVPPPPAAPGTRWTVLDTVLAGVAVRVDALALAAGALLLESQGRVLRGARVVARGAVHVALVPRATLPPLHAALLAGDVALDDRATVDGGAAPPEGWADGCADDTLDVAGLALIAGGTMARSPGARVEGAPADTVVPRAAAGVPADTAWDALARVADVVLAPGATLTPVPAAAAGACIAGDANWGEPARGGGVAACAARMPVVHARGDLLVDGDGRGQGILLVDGTLRVTGRLDYAGVVAARGGVDVAGGLRVAGALVAAQVRLAPADGDDAVVRWSRCSVRTARAASRRHARAPGRAWLQRF